MIARLSGTVADISGDQLIVDVQGVGYAVGVPLREAEALSEGESVTLWVYTAVREDAIQLYGFGTRADKAVFEQLISVSQVGPRLGLNALSKYTAQQLGLAIETNDLKTLSSISGVGRKTAERLVLELRGKMTVAPSPTGGVVAAAPPKVDDGFAIAMAQLGYKRSEIDLAGERLKSEGLTEKPLGERITAALRILSGAAYARPAGA